VTIVIYSQHETKLKMMRVARKKNEDGNKVEHQREEEKRRRANGSKRVRVKEEWTRLNDKLRFTENGACHIPSH